MVNKDIHNMIKNKIAKLQKEGKSNMNIEMKYFATKLDNEMKGLMALTNGAKIMMNKKSYNDFIAMVIVGYLSSSTDNIDEILTTLKKCEKTIIKFDNIINKDTI